MVFLLTFITYWSLWSITNLWLAMHVGFLCFHSKKCVLGHASPTFLCESMLLCALYIVHIYFSLYICLHFNAGRHSFYLSLSIHVFYLAYQAYLLTISPFLFAFHSWMHHIDICVGLDCIDPKYKINDYKHPNLTNYVQNGLVISYLLSRNSSTILLVFGVILSLGDKA